MIENGEWKQMSYRVYVGIFSLWRERGCWSAQFPSRRKREISVRGAGTLTETSVNRLRSPTDTSA